jgi:hypothetical protein
MVYQIPVGPQQEACGLSRRAYSIWKGLVSTLPNHILGLLDKVVDAMAIGLVLNVFGEGYSPEGAT